MLKHLPAPKHPTPRRRRSTGTARAAANESLETPATSPRSREVFWLRRWLLAQSWLQEGWEAERRLSFTYGCGTGKCILQGPGKSHFRQPSLPRSLRTQRSPEPSAPSSRGLPAARSDPARGQRADQRCRTSPSWEPEGMLQFPLLRLVKHPEGQEILTEREGLSRAPRLRTKTAGDSQRQTCSWPGSLAARGASAAAPVGGFLVTAGQDHKTSWKLEKIIFPNAWELGRGKSQLPTILSIPGDGQQAQLGRPLLRAKPLLTEAEHGRGTAGHRRGSAA